MNQQTDDLTHVVELFTNGSVVLCPTDTIWGLSCNAFDRSAVEKIYDIKKRDISKKMILLIGSLTQLRRYAMDIHPRVEDLIIHYEQPLTVIHKASPQVPDYLVSPDGSIAVRLIRHKLLTPIINTLDFPLISTSANLQGEPSPENFEEISFQIKDRVDYVFNSERSGNRKNTASTIIKYSPEGELFFIRE